MKIIFRLITCLGLTLSALFSPLLWSHPHTNQLTNNSTNQIPTFITNEAAYEFMQEMSDTYDYDFNKLTNILNHTPYQKKRKKLIKATKNPAEKTLNWFRYRKLFLQPARINAGVEFWKTHRTKLVRISAHYRIPPEVIVATLGLESFYGKNAGKYSVMNSLISLSFTPHRRNKFYRNELKAFFFLSHTNQWDLDFMTTIKGSYSGAIGPAQFIPSSIKHYTVDWNKDGVKNMLDDYSDIISSIAYYYQQAHWKPGKKILTPLLKYQPKKINSKKILSAEIDNNQKQYWRIGPNFKPILRYNNSKLYALAIYALSQAIKQNLNNP